MSFLSEKRFFPPILKIVACAVLIGFSHAALWRPVWSDAYMIGLFFWLYLGVPFCLIGILTGGRPATLGTGWGAFTGKLILTVAGIFLWFFMGILNAALPDVLAFRPPLWIWNCLYYALLLLILQPQVFGKSFKWVKRGVMLVFLSDTLYLVAVVLLMRSQISAVQPTDASFGNLSGIKTDIGVTE